MRKEKIKLGTIKKQIKETQNYNPEKDQLYITGEIIFIEKHTWDCDWYWGFGYIGNKDLHSHAKVFIEELLWHDKDKVFEESIFKSNNDFWIFKDLLKQAYTLRECAEVYRNGGHCTKEKGITDIILNKDMEKKINNDLRIILETLWDFLTRLK